MANNRSEQLNELFAALAKAQSEMAVAGMASDNPFFKTKYADLAEVVRASRPALTKNNLSVIHQVLPHEDGQYMHTILAHSSGQFIETQIKINPAKQDLQSLGGCITYLRRYTYAAIVGLVASGEDDDGESQMSEARKNGYQRPYQGEERISVQQHKELESLLGNSDLKPQLIQNLKIASLAELPSSKFDSVMRWVISKQQSK
jgi:hypothetical protein